MAKIKDNPATDNGRPRNTVGPRKRAVSPFPKFPLAESVRVAQIIEDTNAGQPLPPVETALALDLSPRNSDFEQITSASIKYGLTTGSSRADVISITDLGQRVVAPLSPEAKAEALLAAALEPETFKRMYEYFKGKKLPEMQFFVNTIVREFGIPREHAEACGNVFTANMQLVGLVKTRGDARYLSTQARPVIDASDDSRDPSESELEEELPSAEEDAATDHPVPPLAMAPDLATPKPNRRVFISHGKDKQIVAQLRELLAYGDFEPIVSVEIETTSKPVPDKVMDDMRACGAGIIHVGMERTVVDQDGNEHQMLNQNVLIEIGAALALYEGRFILLVEQGTTLPSNLQGLYQVRYEGKKLDGDATLKLLKAFKNFKG